MEVRGDHPNAWRAVRRDTRKGLWTVAAAAVLALLVWEMGGQAVYITTGSMRPTLEPGDAILVNRLVYHLHPPRRGDIIVFRYPRAETWDFVKRVIAVPGDVVEGRDCRVWVNEASVPDPGRPPSGSKPACFMNLAARRVPAAQLFVLGDNRGASLDSRQWGTVDEHDVIGKALLIYWSQGERWWEVRWERVGRWLP